MPTYPGVLILQTVCLILHVCMYVWMYVDGTICLIVQLNPHVYKTHKQIPCNKERLANYSNKEIANAYIPSVMPKPRCTKIK